jgi:membrane protein implicated in regulation of membrane protease activity
MEMSIFWLIALIAFGILEAATVGLTSVWFAAGSLCALIVAGAGGALWIQIGVFLVVSFITLVLARPLVQKYVIPKHHATNADRIIGTEAVVKREIDNLKGQGLVSVAGVIWTARSEGGEVIPEGATVRILRIEGVKVFVTPDLSGSQTETN